MFASWHMFEPSLADPRRNMRAQRISDGEATFLVCEALESPVLANDGPVFEILNEPDNDLFGAFYVVLDGASGAQRVKLFAKRPRRDRDEVIRRVGTEWLLRNGPLPTEEVRER
jgi:hypothetical protein